MASEFRINRRVPNNHRVAGDIDLMVETENYRKEPTPILENRARDYSTT